MSNPNTFRSALSKSSSINELVDELCSTIVQPEAMPDPPSVAILFVSPGRSDAFAEICQRLNDQLRPAHLLGCTGEAIVGGAEEIENDECVSLWLAWLPDADLQSMHLNYERSPDGGTFSGWSPTFSQETWPDDVTLLTLGEPYSFPADVFLERINDDRPGVRVVGGMAGGYGPGDARIVVNNEVHDSGAAVLAIRGVPLTTVVSQGCRPIGEPFVITKAERNEILELGGHPAHVQLKAVYDRLPNRDKDLMRLGIHIGRVVDEYKDAFEYGDFLIRHVTGMNQEAQSILVGDYFRPGQTVQFHVRDATTASEDLQQMLGTCSDPVKAGLLFTCNGRGTRLFPHPNHDAGMIKEKFGDIPNAGFFCQGELGPVSGKNFLHGFTASMALFH